VNYTSPSALGSLSYTPVPNATGSALITVTLNDGGASNNLVTRSFTVTITPNTAPTIAVAPSAPINEDTTTGPLALSIGDRETAAGSLTLLGQSGNTNLV